MSYKSLRIYGYNNRKELPAEYKRRFDSYDAKHIDINIGSYPAFFVETKEIRNSVLNLHKMDKEVIKLCSEIPPEALTQFMINCLMDEIQITNSIEGIHSTKKEIRDAYEDRGKRFKGIVDKYRLLMTSASIDITSCQAIRDLYDELVLPEVLEESEEDRPDGKLFRKGNVYISGRKMEPIHEGLYPEETIIDAMDKAIRYLNDDSEELLYRIAVFHYLLGYIHPFYNGNGRLNRFISSYMLTRDFVPLISFRLSYTVKDEQSKYNKAFAECNDKDNRGELTMFVEMFLDVLTESTENLIESLQSRCNAWKRYTGNVAHLPFSSEKHYPDVYKVLILHELFAPDEATIEDIKEATKLSIPTIRKILNAMGSTGLIKTGSIGRKYTYGIDLDKLEELIP